MSDSKYSKKCPFCGRIVWGHVGCNLFCNCFAKYYVRDKVWLDRKTGAEIYDHEKEN